MGFSRQEYWRGLPFPSPGNFLTQGSNPGLLHCRQMLYHLSHQGSWTPMNCCFWTVMLEKTLESPLDCKEISLEYSLEGLMLKLKLQYFGHLMQRTDSFEKTLMLDKIEGGRRRGQLEWDCWMASPTQWTWVWVNSGSWWWTGRPGMLLSMVLQKVGHDWATELNWKYVRF